MIKGFVNEHEEPIIELTLILRNEPRNFPAVIDTGFNGYISVPEKHVKSSDWLFMGYEEYELASGEIVKAKTYLGNIVFDEKQMPTFILSSTSKDILIGTRLLGTKTLFINFIDKKVVINDK
ncbi:hypothetical protein ISS37_00030 [candidate division KSB1 bacterium]|nr:hypothetical protein [candidate division KSB1 bacterium]